MTQHMLLLDPDVDVRVALATNPNVDADVLEKLAGHSLVPPVWVAMHPRTPTYLLERLAAEDFDMSTRHAVLKNANTPEKVLVDAVRSGDAIMRRVAAAHPRLPAPELQRLIQESLDGGEPADLACIAHNPMVPYEYLRKWSQSRSIPVREAIAGNPRTPAHILEQLAADDEIVVIAMARNPSLPDPLRSRLAEHPNGRIRRALAESRYTPAAVLERLTRDRSKVVRDVAREALHRREPAYC